MDWRKELEQLAKVTPNEAILSAKLIEHYAAGDDWRTVFCVLIKLHQHYASGNTYLSLSDIANKAVFSASEGEAQQAQIPEEKAGFELPDIKTLTTIMERWINSSEPPAPFTLIEEKLFIQRYYAYECEVAKLIKHFKRPLEFDLQPQQAALFKSLFMTSLPKEQAPDSQTADSQTSSSQAINWQEIATASALNQGFMLLNGGPGTGKTYTVARILIMLQACFPQLKVELSAPTGKAAQRLGESLEFAIQSLSSNTKCAPYLHKIPKTAQTLHKLIGASIGTSSTHKNQSRKLSADVLIIDEFSMVDLAMFAKLLRACKSSTRIILVGDSAQLPSVEAGNLLYDLTAGSSDNKSPQMHQFLAQLCSSLPQKSDAHYSDHIVTLQTNHRSNEHIKSIANAVHQASYGILYSAFSQGIINYSPDNKEAYSQLVTDKIHQFVNDYIELLKHAKSAQELLQALQSFKVLSPIRHGLFGVNGLNELIAKYIKTQLPSLNTQGQLFHGQAIMISENDYANGLNNGDIGVIWSNTDSSGKARFMAHIERENSQALVLSPNRLSRYESAFAMTIHKTQGSEFDKILIVMPFEDVQAASVELLYTGVTRAKHSIEITASDKSLKASLARTNKRDTYLKALLDD